MSILKKKWTDKDRIKILEKETVKYHKINEALEKEREKAEREYQKAELEIRKLIRKTKLAEAKAREREARARKARAERTVWEERYRKVATIFSPLTSRKRKKTRKRRGR